jgi:hypothetical protein
MQGRWKLIDEGGRIELYDVEQDRIEHNNLAEVQTEVRQTLQAELSDFQQRVRPIGEESIAIPLDTETIEALKELGYGD